MELFILLSVLFLFNFGLIYFVSEKLGKFNERLDNLEEAFVDMSMDYDSFGKRVNKLKQKVGRH